MTRRTDPARLDVARREGARLRLVDLGLSEELAGEWLAAWEREVPRPLHGDAGYWDGGVVWVQKQLATGRRPPQ